MHEATSVLFGPDGFRVLDVQRVDDDLLRVVVETIDRHGASPTAGRSAVGSSSVRWCGSGTWWVIARCSCGGESVAWCARIGSVAGVRSRRRCRRSPARSRLTNRLRAKVASAIAASNRAVAEVAGECRIAGHTAHRALIAAAAWWLPEPAPTAVLGIDETRARSVRWILDQQRWRRSDPWMTSFVDADTSRPGVLLGLAPGRSGACVSSWLAEQTHTFRQAIRTVVIDPSAPYASGIRNALPGVQIAVDHWHLVRLANDMVTEVHQRVARERHGRRGRKTDPAWAHRRMLLTAGNRLSHRQLPGDARIRAGRAATHPDCTGYAGCC